MRLEKDALLKSKKQLPFYDGPNSVKPGSRGRTIDYEFEGQDLSAFVQWDKLHLRKYSPMISPSDGHVLTDQEIDLLIRSVTQGFREDAFESTEQFIHYLSYRQLLPEKTYSAWEADISVCRFFTNKVGEKEENILSDIRRINEEQGMGNVKIPDTNIEIINYSPCPKCKTIHSFSDVFNYYMNPTPDPRFKSKQEQYALDTRVQCKECNDYFLPALIVTDGSPKNECQLICRSQTMREVVVFMQESYSLRVLTMKKENILTHPEDPNKRAWRNDVDARLLKTRQTLFTNFLQYTPAPNILNFITRKNLTLQEPMYGAWMPKEHVKYYE